MSAIKRKRIVTKKNTELMSLYEIADVLGVTIFGIRKLLERNPELQSLKKRDNGEVKLPIGALVGRRLYYKNSKQYYREVKRDNKGFFLEIIEKPKARHESQE